MSNVSRRMPKPPLLEDPSYPGRSGGYVARITGKLLHDCAVSGTHVFFLALPGSSNNHFVFAGPNASGAPIFEIPQEFYKPVFHRLRAICGVEGEATSGKRLVTYSEVPYELALTVVSSSKRGIVLALAPRPKARDA